MGSLAAALARRCASKMPPSDYLCEREAYLHGFERHGNRAVLLPFDQTQFLKARHIGMDIRIIALGGFCQRVNAARAFAAQCVGEVQARRTWAAYFVAAAAARGDTALSRQTQLAR